MPSYRITRPQADISFKQICLFKLACGKLSKVSVDWLFKTFFESRGMILFPSHSDMSETTCQSMQNHLVAYMVFFMI